MFWENFSKLCDENATNPNAVAAAIGLSNAICTKWKNGTVPKGKTLNLLAEYFNVSVDYLLTGENKKIPSGLTEEDWELFDLIKRVPPEFYESSKAFLQALVKKQDQE